MSAHTHYIKCVSVHEQCRVRSEFKITEQISRSACTTKHNAQRVTVGVGRCAARGATHGPNKQTTSGAGVWVKGGGGADPDRGQRAVSDSHTNDRRDE